MPRLSTFARPLSVALLAGTMLASTAFAQPGGGGGGGGDRGRGGGMQMMGGFGGGPGGMFGGFDPPVTSEQLKKYDDQLGLSDEQREAAKALFDGYFASFQAKADEARKAMDSVREQFRETRDPSVFEKMGESMIAFRKARTEAERAFLNDYKSLLTEEQAAQWPKLERSRRREATIRQGFIAGERIDVVRLVDQLKLTPEQLAAVQPTIDAYEQELDPALAKRNEFMENAMGQGMGMARRFMNGEGPDENMQKMFEEGRANAQRVRDINRRYATQIEGALPADLAAKFRDEVNRESYPMVYRTRYPQTAIAAVEAFPDLTDEQKASLASLKDTYNRDLSALQDKGRKAQDDMEASFSLQNMGGMFNNEALRDLRSQGESLDNKTIESLKALLTPEQAAKLPERRQGGGRGGMDFQMDRGGGDGGGGGDQPGQRRRNRGNQQPPV